MGIRRLVIGQLLVIFIWALDLTVLTLHYQGGVWTDGDPSTQGYDDVSLAWIIIRGLGVGVQWSASIFICISEIILFCFLRSVIKDGLRELRKQVYIFFGILIAQMLIREILTGIITLQFWSAIIPERQATELFFQDVRIYVICNGVMEIVLTIFLDYYLFQGRTRKVKPIDDQENLQVS